MKKLTLYKVSTVWAEGILYAYIDWKRDPVWSIASTSLEKLAVQFTEAFQEQYKIPIEHIDIFESNSPFGGSQ